MMHRHERTVHHHISVSTEDEFQANSKKNWWNILEAEEINPTKYKLVASQKNCQYESSVWGT